MATPANKKLTLAQIQTCADSIGVERAALQAVISVETSGSGFYSDGKPVILFEPHIFYRLLTQKGLTKTRDTVMQNRPDLCYPKWGSRKYGSSSIQPDRLNAASQYHRESALEACSWGLGQIMGYHWRNLGYPSLQAFVNAMYRDEASQLDAMCRFIKTNKLVDELQRHDWATFAYRYNGAGYKTNQYDKKLADAYRRFAAH